MTESKIISIPDILWEDISELQEPGMSFPELLEIMIEHEKKWRLVEDIKRIQNEEELVDVDF